MVSQPRRDLPIEKEIDKFTDEAEADAEFDARMIAQDKKADAELPGSHIISNTFIHHGPHLSSEGRSAW